MAYDTLQLSCNELNYFHPQPPPWPCVCLVSASLTSLQFPGFHSYSLNPPKALTPQGLHLPPVLCSVLTMQLPTPKHTHFLALLPLTYSVWHLSYHGEGKVTYFYDTYLTIYYTFSFSVYDTSFYYYTYLRIYHTFSFSVLSSWMSAPKELEMCFVSAIFLVPAIVLGTYSPQTLIEWVGKTYDTPRISAVSRELVGNCEVILLVTWFTLPFYHQSTSKAALLWHAVWGSRHLKEPWNPHSNSCWGAECQQQPREWGIKWVLLGWAPGWLRAPGETRARGPTQPCLGSDLQELYGKIDVLGP